jgi:hypothetical protein
MDIETLLSESTHFKTNKHGGISFATAMKCEECGADIFQNWSAWLSFKGVSQAECMEEAIHIFGMTHMKDEYPNEGYYCEENESEESCGECM